MGYPMFFNTIKKYSIPVDEEYVINIHRESIEHMIRCSIIAKEFAEFLGLSEINKEKLYECALLHDLGKLKLNPEILYKNTRLTDAEFKYIKTHTSINGKEGCLDKCILDCINYHHDNIISTGYNKINVCEKHEFVRIISLIDCYDAMSHKRCYKDFIYSKDEIISDIKNLIGKQFDYFYGHKFIDYLNKNKRQKALSYIS